MSTDETREQAWQDTVAHFGTSASEEMMAHLKRYFFWGWDARAALPSAPADVTALIAELRDYSAANKAQGLAMTADRYARAAAALESLSQGTGEQWEYGTSVPAMGDKPGAETYGNSLESALAVQRESTTTYKKWTHGNPVLVWKRRPAGPWLPVEWEA